MNTSSFSNADHKTPAKDLLATHLEHTTELYKRAVFAQQVIRNTILKLSNMEIPGHLLWARRFQDPLYIMGVSSNARSSATTSMEQFAWQEGEARFVPVEPVGDGDSLMVTTFSGGRSYIPLRLLNYDPIAIAQWVRTLVREATVQHRADARVKLARERQEIIAVLEREARERQELLTDVDRQLAAVAAPMKPQRKDAKRS